jgi:hypothetical protein
LGENREINHFFFTPDVPEPVVIHRQMGIVAVVRYQTRIHLIRHNHQMIRLNFQIRVVHIRRQILKMIILNIRVRVCNIFF